MAEKQKISIKVEFYVLDGGNQNMQQFVEVTCPNSECGNVEQLANWRNDGSESLRSLICPKCGKKLYTVTEAEKAVEKMTDAELAKAISEPSKE